jgi:hypothetical protein
MRRKTIYLCAAFLTFLTGVIFASFWLFNFRNNAPLNPDEVGAEAFLDSENKAAEYLLQKGVTFKLTSVGDGYNSVNQGYETSDGRLVDTSSKIYESESKAKEAFKKEIRNIKPIYTNGISDNYLEDTAKFIGIGKYDASGKQFALIAYLNGKDVM